MKSLLSCVPPCVHPNELRCGEPRELTPTHASEALAVQQEMNLDPSIRPRASTTAAGSLATGSLLLSMSYDEKRPL